ncbi:putative lipoprotein [hydrothermal vent metagenome]|uniref:Putative lipoprotein n=1 Tax=hydrothermal vent metagenome TaxID=652676 RepID=A0A1W1E7L9_9ZZZZ
MMLRKSSLAVMAALTLLFSNAAQAEAAKVIDAKADVAIEKFKKLVKGGDVFLKKVKGYLVFPTVYKGGFVVGGEYGEGVLRVNGKSVAYYNIASASVGLQIGAQKTSYIFAFADQFALDQFMRSNGWQAGVDGSIAVAKWGQGIDISSISFEKPIYAFVFDNKGLMANISLEGTKFTRIIPQ